MKINTSDNKIRFDDKLKIWNEIKSIIIVAKDPKVPGIIFILPKPNIVTNNVLKFLFIFWNWNYTFTSDSFFFTYQT